MKKVIVILLSFVFVAMAFAVFAPVSHSQDARGATTTPEISAIPLKSTIMSELSARGIPAKYASLPNLNVPAKFHDGVVSPSYTSSPAPMGIGYYGTENISGHMVSMNTTTSSVMASINVYNFSDFYLLNDGPQSVTFQLNSVLNNVTLFGNSSYTFWTQNVVFYSARVHQLTFLDNIWNFSSPAIYMSPNALYSYNGNLVSPVFYFDVGPTINVTYPFHLSLYLNSSVVDNRTAMFFNYSITTGGKSMSGSYDQVMFNSTYGMPASYSAPSPKYLASGTRITPTGYIAYDFEIMVGGPGGGSTSSLFSLNATMNLMYKSGAGYVNVPSAYDVASQTGETSEGVSVSWEGSTAHLSAGPSLVYGMWNISSVSSMTTFTGNIAPSNAFAFVSPAPFNVSMAAWMPLSSSGSYDFSLPSASYAVEVLMSDYSPVSMSLGASMHISLTRNNSMGIYTPLFAMNNNQIMNISLKGTGTSSNPYIIDNVQNSPINPIFGEFNDYGFPVFYGLLLMNTNAHVVIKHMPSLLINYTDSAFSGLLAFYQVPTYNYLNYEFYNTSNVSMWQNYHISGWFTYGQSGFPVANIVVWNSTSFLVGSNAMSVMDSGLLVYGSPNMTIWGNYILESSEVFVNDTFYASTNIWGAPLGIAEYSSGDVIYNNFFAVQFNAYSPNSSIYSGQPAVYVNAWNITKQSSSNVHMFNGFALSGSIIGTSYQGGNFWWNFNGVVPYNNYGLIYYGGDYEPLFY